jgi:hypothetical protein
LSNKFRDKPFSTYDLHQRLQGRDDSPSQLWLRFPNDRNILLVSQHNEKGNMAPTMPRSRFRLTLTFDLRDATLDQDQIELLVNMFGNYIVQEQLLGIRRINWDGIKPTAQDLKS